MGNKLGSRRQMVDEKYTQPQGLYQHVDMDPKKLKKLILDLKLAPCYPGDDECSFNREECPICFLVSNVVGVSFSTLPESQSFKMLHERHLYSFECLFFSRVFSADEVASFYPACAVSFSSISNNYFITRCPFCKTSNYDVEYRGVMSKEEKCMEQVEEQRFIEAKIRMQQQELQDEEERTQRRQRISSSSRKMTQREVEGGDVSSSSLPGDKIIPSLGSFAETIVRQPSHSRQDREDEDEFDQYLEDIMLTEAIWLSIQENATQRHPDHGDAAPFEPFVTEGHYVSPAVVPLTEASAPSGGLACAIAAFAERQQMNRDSTNYSENVSAFGMLRSSSRLPNREEEPMAEIYPPESWIEVSPGSERAVSREDGEWEVDLGSEVAEAGTSYASSETTTGEAGIAALSHPDAVGGYLQPNITGAILPESFEDQMMLATAVSLAEARSRTSTQGVAWL
ncbi:hypothetical protein HHK36_001562 [Tetracentron sinense]|uniref:Uncharacterized protein n=1 Tax=Tetracentron sinense TaxID=13715 RepID=A0A835A2Y9_TETSI|nr:hypothetical protein HHK36_001562 [Tetracentron sinense]